MVSCKTSCQGQLPDLVAGRHTQVAQGRGLHAAHAAGRGPQRAAGAPHRPQGTARIFEVLAAWCGQQGGCCQHELLKMLTGNVWQCRCSQLKGHAAGPKLAAELRWPCDLAALQQAFLSTTCCGQAVLPRPSTFCRAALRTTGSGKKPHSQLDGHATDHVGCQLQGRLGHPGCPGVPPKHCQGDGGSCAAGAGVVMHTQVMHT